MLALLLIACAAPDEPAPDLTVTERQPGERAPLTAACDDQDPLRCLLPWPSSTFTRADASSETGLRLAVDLQSLNEDDDPAYLDNADGFSRLTPLVTGFSTRLDTSWVGEPGQALHGAPLHLLVAQPDAADQGREIPLWADVAQDPDWEEDLVVAYPLEVLAPGTDHVVVVTRDLRGADGAELPVERPTLLALGLADPETTEEAALVGYHAPTRALLDAAGIAPEDVLRVWDFTTRSEWDATRRLLSMVEQAAGATDVTVQVASATQGTSASIATIVRGTLSGIPGFLDDDDRLVLDAQGLPVPQGDRAVEFRVVVPAEGYDGSTDYRVAMYGHGTGGDVTDTAFDDDIASWGVAKVSLQIGAWNGQDLVTTLSRLPRLAKGTEQSTALLMQSVVDGQAILAALDGPLGEVLAADELDGAPNPAAGRHPDLDAPVWVGGSLGGTFGAVAGAAWPEVGAAVLNVPAAAWTHIIPDSMMYEGALESVLMATYDGVVDVRLAIAISQGNWDDMDGAAWSERAREGGAAYLLQESVGAPIVPNPGTHMLAIALGAGIVGPALVPVEGLGEVDVVTAGAGLTQFKVPDGGAYDVHGFAARSTPAGDAAMEQIQELLRSYWEGAPTISFPDGCADVTPDGSCDFSGMWDEE